MTYIQHTPAPPLNAYIRYLYHPNGSSPYRCEKILPMPSLDLKINFGGAVTVYGSNQGESLATCAQNWVVGVWNAYHIVEWPSDLQYLGVSFRPGGAYPFLQLPLAELRNQIVPLDAIWGQAAAEIRERLYAASSIGAQFALLEQFLLARLCETLPELRAVQYAIGEIVKQHGALSIRALSDDIGVSHKHLITQFKRMAGETPKAFARLSRFVHALGTIDPTRRIDWTWIAHQAHYYDQAHFNHDFEMYTGHTPTDYLRLRHRVHIEYPEHIHHQRLLPAG